jgi:N-acetylmuramoyl-L-alanine amidase
MKVAIIVGHNSVDQGADCPPPLESRAISEYAFNDQVARFMAASAPVGMEIKVIYRPAVKSYSRQVHVAYGEADRWGADYTMELHFNWWPEASGTLTLSSGSERSMEFCRAIHDVVVRRLGLPDCGVEVREQNSRGGLALYVGKAPAALMEPFFCSNPGDVRHMASLPGGAAARLGWIYLEALAVFAQSKGLPVDASAFGNAVEVTEGVTEQPAASDPMGLGGRSLRVVGLSKEQFLVENLNELRAMVDAANESMTRLNHSEALTELTLPILWSVLNSEIGLTHDGEVDVHHVHSNGEAGLLPLPSNLSFWTGLDAPLNDVELPVEQNVFWFAVYLVGVMNKNAGVKFSDGYVYDDLFDLPYVVGDDFRLSRVLAAAVHGWFYHGNYKAGVTELPCQCIVVASMCEGEVAERMLGELGYRHASVAGLIVNRLRNVDVGYEMALAAIAKTQPEIVNTETT